jgi:hypothetical protein
MAPHPTSLSRNERNVGLGTRRKNLRWRTGLNKSILLGRRDGSAIKQGKQFTKVSSRSSIEIDSDTSPE